ASGEPPDVLTAVRDQYPGILVAAGGYDRARAESLLQRKGADLVAFGRPFISNPDLVERMQCNAPLSEWDRKTFYTRGPAGYVDYPNRNGLVDEAYAPYLQETSKETSA